MKKMTLAIAVLSLAMTSATVGMGQSRSRARGKPAPTGEQICTGCCDPCYADDWWKVRHPQTAVAKNKTVNRTGKSAAPTPGRKARR